MKNGLSKIDILVLAGIILFLAGNIPLIMAGGQKNAKRQVCMANLRELYSAWVMYAEDSKGKIPPGDIGFSWSFPASIGGPQRAWVEWPHRFPHPMPPTANTNGVNGSGAYTYSDIANLNEQIWKHSISEGLLWNYVKDYRIYRCPDANRVYYTTYNMSHSMNTWRDTAGSGTGSAGKGSISRTFSNINQIAEPANRFVFLDTGSAKQAAFYINYDGQNSALPGTWGDRPPSIHNMGTNFVFADGHVIYRRWTHPHALAAITESYWGGGPIDYCDCDLRWMVKITWGDIPSKYICPDNHCEY